jgi:hypothetical protein
VGALGIPLFGPARILQIFRSKHQFHDTDVTPGNCAQYISNPRPPIICASTFANRT